MADTVRQVAQRLSLRSPQRESLEILEKISKAVGFDPKEETAKKLERAAGLDFRAFREFERGFPTFAFALATGVGKTRLMGAAISYLFMEHGIKDYLVLAPNLTIYNKLIEDFSNVSSLKYVFTGIGEFVHSPPKIITGDNYANVNTVRTTSASSSGQYGLFANEVFINIFNIAKINAETKGGAAPRIKRLSEYLGESYFEYLCNIDKLVLLMDEAHQYRAERGMAVINELNPIMGLEFTATAKVKQGNNFIPFKNIVYDYALGQAMRDGFVKEPAVATRRNLSQDELKKLKPEELDQLKLEDAIRVHENTKTHLLRYAKDNRLPVVKPFILVIAQDTEHAGELAQFVRSDKFFDGKYADKVITVHSNQKGEEKEENVEQLLSLERHENPIEIVIHVNMLKEGWDVKNLYTIVPLRAFATSILTEQTLGRGLRLPYGARTGDPEVDQLTVIAHEHFDAIIKEAQKEGSIVYKQTIIDIDNPAFSAKQEVVTVKNMIEEKLAQEESKAETITDEEARNQAAIELKVKRLVLDQLKGDSTQSFSLNPSDVGAKDTQAHIQEIVQGVLPHYGGSASSEEVVKKVTKAIIKDFLPELIKASISIPWIMVQPKHGAVQAGFKDFSLKTTGLPKFHPIHDEIQIKTLRDQKDSYIGVINSAGVKDTNENRIVARLIDHEEVDYEAHGDLLYKLAGEMLGYLHTYVKESKDVDNVVETQSAQIAEQIWQQMKDQFYCETTEYEEPVVKPFVKIESHNYSKMNDVEPTNFKATVSSSAELRRTLFTGFKKSCHAAYKFDSIPEFNFAKVLEADGERDVLKWLRPAPRQFHLHWNLQGSSYEPDFVVESKDGIWIVEVKAKNELEAEDTQEKKRAALQYCLHASEYNLKHGGKRWGYLLVPDDEIQLNRDFPFYMRTYSQG